MRVFAYRGALTLCCALGLLACGGGTAGDTSNSTPPPTTTAPPVGEDPAAPKAPALPRGVHELSTTEPSASDADLAPFDAIVGSTEMVGLGETVHTSGGYHRMRDRLVRHLIEKLGFRAVALETPWATAEVATKYVETCEGSTKAASSSIFGVFASVEMASLFDWLCTWNKSHPTDKVAFWGYDVQDPWADGALLRAFVKKAAPGKSDVVAALDACHGVKYDTFTAYAASPEAQASFKGQDVVTVAANDQCKSAIGSAKAWLAADQTTLAAATSESDTRLAKLALDSIEANQAMMFRFNADPIPSFEARDTGMAKTLIAMRELRSPKKRVAVIAHNTHLAHAGSAITGVWQGARVMGQILREDHKAPYEAIALAAYEVKINWGNFDQPPLADGKDAVENLLFGLKKPLLLVDLQSNALLDQTKDYELQAERMIPASQFRALVYLEKSEPMKYAPR
jgi:erythromycin esterase-like protein